MSLIFQWAGFTFLIIQGIISYRLDSSLLEAFSPLLIVFLLGWFAFLHLFVQRSLESVYHLSADGIIVQRHNEKQTYSFSEIEAIQFSQNKITRSLLGGFYRIEMKSGKHLLLSIAIERSEYILELLFAARPDLLDQNDFQRIRVRALILDHQWGHLQDTVRLDSLELVAKIFILPLVQTILWSLLSSDILIGEVSPFQKILSFLCINVLIYHFVYALNAWVLFRAELERLTKDPNAVRRDLNQERLIRKKFEWVFWGFAVAVYALSWL